MQSSHDYYKLTYSTILELNNTKPTLLFLQGFSIHRSCDLQLHISCTKFKAKLHHKNTGHLSDHELVYIRSWSSDYMTQNNYRVRKFWYCETVGFMRQHKFCPDKQQHNNINIKPFLVCVVATEVIENYYECVDMVHYSVVCTCPINPIHAS